MKKLLLTAFICIAANAYSTPMPTCNDLQRDIGVPMGQIQDPVEHQKRLDNLKAAALKDPALQVAINLLAFCGVVVPKDVPKAMRLLEEDARAGRSYAGLLLYAIYGGFFGSEEGQKDDAKAKWHLNELERNGGPETQFDIGASYYRGDDSAGLPKSRVKAEQMWIRAAAGGWVNAYGALGGLYLEDNKSAEAQRWLELGNAAGGLREKYMLGYLLAVAPGLQAEAARGIQLLKSAAEKAYVPSQYSLGTLYFNGVGVTKDIVEALRWFRMAAESNNADALGAIAYCYEFGIGVPLDLKQALQWRQKAAAGGLATAKAALEPSRMYPKVVTSFAAKDLAESTKWYRLAAEDGNPEVQLNLARYLAQADRQEAMKWYGLAAAQGNTAAMADMGVIYWYGRLGTNDVQEGFRLTRLAAEKGDKDARFHLSRAYAQGERVAKNMVVAYALQLIMDPQAQDTRLSKAYLTQLEIEMAPDEVDKAKQLALALVVPGKFQSALDSALKP